MISAPRRCLFVSISLLIGLAAAEFFLRATYPIYSDYNTEMWRYAAKLKVTTGDADLPFVHVRNSAARLYGTEIRTNNAGWRDRRDVELAKRPGQKRILVLGDSIAMGWGVDLDKTFPALLESMFRSGAGADVQVLNTGVGNYNTRAEVATLKKALAYRPDLIVIAASINDAEILPTYRTTPASWVKKNSYLYNFLWDKLTLLGYELKVSRPYQEYYLGLYRSGSAERLAFEGSVRELLTIAERERIPLLAVAIPETHDFVNYPFGEITSVMRTAFTAGGYADFLDLRPFFAPYEPRSTWVSPEDAHPNALGHRIMAEAVYGRLRERRWP